MGDRPVRLQPRGRRVRESQRGAARRLRGPLVTSLLAAALVGSLPTLIAPSLAAAQSIAGELRVGGGYDSNPTLAAPAGNRRAPEGEAVELGDGLLAVAGSLTGSVGTDWRGIVRFDLDGRVYGRGEVLFAEQLAVGFSHLEDVWSVGCQLEGSRLDITLSDDDSWTGGGSCRFAWAIGEGFGLDVLGRGSARVFDADQLDGLASGGLFGSWTLDAFSVRLGLTALRRESDGRFATRTEIIPELRVRLAEEIGGGEASYRMVVREFESDSRDGFEHVVRVRGWVMPLPWLGAYAELGVGVAHGRPQALAYERVEVHGGVRLATSWTAPVSALPPDDGPAVVEEGFVRFSFAIPGASEVAIVGTLNEWDEERGRLVRHGDRFVGRFRVQPGRLEYHLVVDGEARRPPGASRYARDGFGGENAVLTVP